MTCDVQETWWFRCHQDILNMKDVIIVREYWKKFEVFPVTFEKGEWNGAFMIASYWKVIRLNIVNLIINIYFMVCFSTIRTRFLPNLPGKRRLRKHCHKVTVRMKLTLMQHFSKVIFWPLLGRQELPLYSNERWSL